MAEATPAPDRLFAAALERLLTPLPARIGLAVSGGGDSMAMLVLAQRWAAVHPARLHVASVDHGLRPESRAEAEMVARFCCEHDLDHEILTIGTLPDAGNLSALARTARYRALAGWAGRRSVDRVLLGHTLDDQAETVLMRLARGSGAEGLSAMHEQRRADGVTWLRPLLGVRREALREVLRAGGVAWADDPTNDNEAYDRVKARKALSVLAPLGITPEGLAATAARLGAQRLVLEQASCALARDAVRAGACGEIYLDRARIWDAPRDTALRVFGEALRTLASQDYRARYRALEAAFDAAFSGAPGARPATLGGCLIDPRHGDGQVLICREGAALPPRRAFQGDTVWDGRWVMAARMPPEDGALIGPLGACGTQRLDRLARDGQWTPPEAWRATPRAVRQGVPALWHEDGGAAGLLLAVPSAGYCDPRAAAFAITATIRD